MILVDTSVLIDYLRGRKTSASDLFHRILETEVPWGINTLIYQEVLQGAGSTTEFNRLKHYFDTFPFYELQYGRESYERAARLNLRCRRAGVTVRGTVDLIIAETAIENDLFLFHHDHDFNRMAEVIPELQIFTGLIR